MFNVKDFGAEGDRETNDRAAFQAAMDACSQAAGGTVLVPAGDYLSGTIRLRSHVTLHLDAGATLWASTDPDDYEDEEIVGGQGRLLVVDGAQDVSIVGTGTIRGEGDSPLGWNFGVAERPPFRVGLSLFHGCRNVRIRDVTFLYSDCYTLHLRRCEQVFIDGITIFNDIRHINSDGIDPDSCRDVHISNCHIVAGDDCIVLKAEEPYPCENVVVNNCTLETTCAGLKLGTESHGDFRNIHVSNCTIRNTRVGIGFYLKDDGTMEQVTFSDISIENDLSCGGADVDYTKPESWGNQVYPIFMDIERRHPDSRVGVIRDVSFNNIHIRSGAGILIQGMPESPIDNLSLQNVTLRVDSTVDWAKRHKAIGGRRTTSDERDTLYARKSSYVTLAHLKGLTLENVRVLIAEDAFHQYERSAVSIHETENGTIRNVYRSPAGEGGQLPIVALHNCQRMLITGCLAMAGTPPFLGLSGDRSADISLVGNDLRAARRATTQTEEVPAGVIHSL